MVIAALGPIIAAGITAAATGATLGGQAARRKNLLHRQDAAFNADLRRAAELASAIARSTPGVSPGLTQRNALQALNTQTADAVRLADARRQQQQAENFQVQQMNRQAIGGTIGAIGGGVAQGISANQGQQNQQVKLDKLAQAPNPTPILTADQIFSQTTAPQVQAPPGPPTVQGAEANQVAAAQAQVPPTPQPVVPPQYQAVYNGVSESPQMAYDINAEQQAIDALNAYRAATIAQNAITPQQASQIANTPTTAPAAPVQLDASGAGLPTAPPQASPPRASQPRPVAPTYTPPSPRRVPPSPPPRSIERPSSGETVVPFRQESPSAPRQYQGEAPFMDRAAAESISNLVDRDPEAAINAIMETQNVDRQEAQRRLEAYQSAPTRGNQSARQR